MSINYGLIVLLIWSLCPVSSLAQTTKSGIDSTPKGVNAKAKAAIEASARIESHGPRDLTKAQLWAIACPALLDQMNGNCHDRLATRASTAENIADQKSSLVRWWRVSNREDLLNTLKWIDNGGHRQYFDKYTKAVESNDLAALGRLKSGERDAGDFANRLSVCRDNYKELAQKSLIGWDYCRYIDLCRWGYLCGYLDEEEAWAKIMPAAKLLQSTFDSWADLGNNYLIGRMFWSSYISAKDARTMREIYGYLLTNSNSPWKNCPWAMQL